jgi:hypothetical protein
VQILFSNKGEKHKKLFYSQKTQNLWLQLL